MALVLVQESSWKVMEKKWRKVIVIEIYEK